MKEVPPAAARGMFGRQHVSTRHSAPEFGFGSGNRESYMKMHMTEAHSRATNAGAHSPGPVYPALSSLGKMEDSRRRSGPQSIFSKDTRFAAYSKDVKAFPSAGKSPIPGAGAYEIPGSFGKQGYLTKKKAPSFGFGSASRYTTEKQFYGNDYTSNVIPCSPGPTVCSDKSSMGPQASRKSNPSWPQSTERRFKYRDIERAAKLPGAGSYDHKSAMGVQAMSIMRSLPQFSFGTGSKSDSKMHISHEHSAHEMYGKASQGPQAAYQIEGCLGRQVDARKKTASTATFGTATRFNANTANQTKRCPGPGAYSPQ